MSTVYISDITVTAGSPTVTVNSSEDISQFKKGDLIFMQEGLPLTISSILAKVITLNDNALFSAANSTALIIPSNVVLRDALYDIQKNNSDWTIHFQPFMDFVSSSSEKVTMVDANGNDIEAYSANGLNSLADDIISANLELNTLEPRVNAVESQLAVIEPTLDDLVLDAQAEAQNAKDWATKDTEVEVGLESAKTYAAQAANNAGLALGYKNQAETILDNFDDRYLGAKASDPLVDNDGDPLIDGAIYLNTTTAPESLRFFVGSVWLSPEESVISNVALSLQYRNEAQTFRNEAEIFRDQAEAIAGGVAPDSLRLGGQLPSFYAKTTDITETKENPQTQTLTREAKKTVLNVSTGVNTFTITSASYLQGDKIEVNKLRQNTPTITTALDEDNIIFPDGTTDDNVTQELTATFTITITKRSDGDWDLTVRN